MKNLLKNEEFQIMLFAIIVTAIASTFVWFTAPIIVAGVII